MMTKNLAEGHDDRKNLGEVHFDRKNWHMERMTEKLGRGA
jgi:hypothetical protein